MQNLSRRQFLKAFGGLAAFAAMKPTQLLKDVLTPNETTITVSGLKEGDWLRFYDGEAYPIYIDKEATSTTESFTVVYESDRDLLVRVRDDTLPFPIKTFETKGWSL